MLKSACLDWVRPEKSFKNSQTFHKPLQYGMEKREGTQLFRTSGKGVQPLL